jgi:peptidoglycan/xylan/chitin deacetylase (PgdA/CDA1 family)
VRTTRTLVAVALAAALAASGCSAPRSTTWVPAAPPSGAAPPGSGGPAGFPADLAGKDVERLPTDRKVAALTFDAGANADAVPAILATLSRERITGTFFLTGDFVTRYPDAARQITRAGHLIGNHSATHPAFTGLALARIRSEVEGAAQSIRTVTGVDPRPLFRFPFGDRDARAIAAVNGLGYVPVRWTVDAVGWQGTMNGTRTVSYTIGRVLQAVTPGMIVLMHVGSNPADHSTLDADALPAVIAGLRQRGYDFVTLAMLRG